MSARQRIGELAGNWSGDNRLWLMPTDPTRESKTTARVELAAGGGFVLIRYDWADEGKPQDGALIVRNAVLSMDRGDEFRVLMYNVSPDGEVYPAVEARYERTAGG